MTKGVLSFLWAVVMPLSGQESVPPDLLAPLKLPGVPVATAANGEMRGTVVLLGGSNAAECQRYGWMELRLLASGEEDGDLRLRNLAWPADTLFHHPRPRNFFGAVTPDYGEADGRERIEADMIVCWFGQMESLEGEGGLSSFVKAYDALLERILTYTSQVVLVTPVPFEDPLDLGIDVEKRNAALQSYAEAIGILGEERGIPVVDLGEGLRGKSGFTLDGGLLGEQGHQWVAEIMAEKLGWNQALPELHAYVRQAIQEKNEIWHRYWVPTNWAFLYGNRQTQPSSRDHENPQKRWFPAEVEEFREQAEEMEEEIWEEIR
ncbi:MAG: hypothetical protein AAGJ31_00955 [Verrucomicrobiota bacterium]